MRNDDRVRRYGFAVLVILARRHGAQPPTRQGRTGGRLRSSSSSSFCSQPGTGPGPGLFVTGLIALMTLAAPLTSWRAVRLALFVMGEDRSASSLSASCCRRRAEENRRALRPC